MKDLTTWVPTSATQATSALVLVLAPPMVGAREPLTAPHLCPLLAKSMRARTTSAATGATKTPNAVVTELAPPGTGARDHQDAPPSSL